MEVMEWTTDTVIRLVKEYRKRPQLWDHQHESYRVQSAKYEAWSELAEIFSCDIVDVRKKLNSLLASRRREKARVRDGGRTTWFLYPYLNFLAGHIDAPDIEYIVNTDATEQEQEDDQIDQEAADADETDATDAEEEAVVVKREPQPTYQYITTSPSNVPQKKAIKRTVYRSHTRRGGPLKRKAFKSNTKIEDTRQDSISEPNLSNLNTTGGNLDVKIAEIIKLLRKTENCKKKDECDTFGEYIASSLRKHDDRTQSMIKQAINNILFEQEMKKYNTSGTYTVIVSDPIENPLGSVHLTEDK